MFYLSYCMCSRLLRRNCAVLFHFRRVHATSNQQASSNQQAATSSSQQPATSKQPASNQQPAIMQPAISKQPVNHQAVASNQQAATSKQAAIMNQEAAASKQLAATATQQPGTGNQESQTTSGSHLFSLLWHRSIRKGCKSYTPFHALYRTLECVSRGEYYTSQPGSDQQ